MTVYASPYAEFLNIGRSIDPGMSRANIKGLLGGIQVAPAGTVTPLGFTWRQIIPGPIPAGEKISIGQLPPDAIIWGAAVMATQGGTIDFGDIHMPDRFVKDAPADGSITQINNPEGFHFRTPEPWCLYAKPATAITAGILHVHILYSKE